MNIELMRIKPWLWLSVPITLLVTLAAGAGFFVEATYAGDVPYFAEQGVAQDFILLSLALPVLVASMVFGLRGSQKAVLVWLGCIAYLLYSYILYAFSVSFNRLFLVYIAILSLSLYALIGGIAASLREPSFPFTLGRRLSRWVQIFLVIVAMLFYFVWLSEALPAVIQGSVPQSVIDNGLPSNPVHVLDMGVLLPALLISAWLLRKEEPLGVLLAGMNLCFMVLMGATILSLVVFLALAGFEVVAPMAVIFTTLTALSLLFLILFLRGLGNEGKGD